VGATFLPPLSGIGNNLAQSLALCALWILLIAVLWDLFFAVVFFRGNLGVFSAPIGLSTLDYNRWTYRGNLLLYPVLILLVHFQLHPLRCSACDHWPDAPDSDFRPLIVVSVLAGLVVDLLL